MTTVTQQDFQRSMQNRQVNLDDLRSRVSPEQHARLKKADADGDGVIKGNREMQQLWRQLDSFDRNGTRSSIETGSRGRPSLPGRVHNAIQGSARPASQQPRRGLSCPEQQPSPTQPSTVRRPDETQGAAERQPSTVRRPDQAQAATEGQAGTVRRPDQRPSGRPRGGPEHVQQTQQPGRVPQTVQAAAQELLNNPNVRFWNRLSTGSDRANLERLARGEQALANVTGQRVTPSLRMMQALVAMGRAGPIQINALTGGRHSHGSQHYHGNAVDLAIHVGNQQRIMDIARQYGGRRNGETTHMHISF